MTLLWWRSLCGWMILGAMLSEVINIGPGRVSQGRLVVGDSQRAIQNICTDRKSSRKWMPLAQTGYWCPAWSTGSLVSASSPGL